MRQGATPKHTFTIPFDTKNVEKIRVYYKQGDELKLKKTEADATMDGNEISVKLTQEDTLSLDCDKKTLIQLRVVTNVGDAFVSDVFTVATGMCLENEVV